MKSAWAAGICTRCTAGFEPTFLKGKMRESWGFDLDWSLRWFGETCLSLGFREASGSAITSDTTKLNRLDR